jgi:hypothetical protein
MAFPCTHALKSSLKDSDTFVNDSPIGSFMQPALDVMNMREGNSIYFGLLSRPTNSSVAVSADESLQRRAQAAKDFVNIDFDERERRRQASKIMYAVTAAYVVWSTWVDAGGIAGHLLRLGVVVPLFLALGYDKSAKVGLCNIAQAGLWDGEYDASIKMKV